MVRKLINSAPQAAVTTFALTSDFVFLFGNNTVDLNQKPCFKQYEKRNAIITMPSLLPGLAETFKANVAKKILIWEQIMFL